MRPWVDAVPRSSASLFSVDFRAFGHRREGGIFLDAIGGQAAGFTQIVHASGRTNLLQTYAVRVRALLGGLFLPCIVGGRMHAFAELRQPLDLKSKRTCRLLCLGACCAVFRQAIESWPTLLTVELV